MSGDADMRAAQLTMREALERIRLHGSKFWDERWGTPSKLADEAMLATDGAMAADEEADPYLAEVKAAHAGRTITAEAMDRCAADAQALAEQAERRLEGVREALTEGMTNALSEAYLRGVRDGWAQRG